MSLDCQSCGACCVNTTDSKWIQVSEQDSLKLDPSWLQDGDIEKYAMKQLQDGRCVKLEGTIGGKCSCTIYENRPAICREVQPEDSICNSSRLSLGIIT